MFLINDKTRRGGFSYMEAIGSANFINLTLTVLLFMRLVIISFGSIREVYLTL